MSACPVTAPAPARACGFSLLELVVCLAVILLVAGMLLSRLHYYQEAAERADMEYTANTLKLALQLRIGRDLGQQRPVDYAAVMSENPVSWLERPMKGYRGEVGQAEARLLPRGSWYFDHPRRELVYLPLRDSQLAPDSDGFKRIRYRLRLVRAQAGARKDDTAVLGVQLAPAEPYRWP
jgi:prepilin-type N-terminal cleavage/methylation domain-containing protein